MKSATLRLRADRALLRSRGHSVRYLLASITAPKAPPREGRMPVNVALVLDRSGSMQGENKFPLAVKAVEEALRLLSENDRYSLVVFDDRVDVLTHSALATADAKKRTLRALQQIMPRNSTDLCSGWMHGCDELAAHLSDETISRVLLLTDGQANHGEVNRDVLAHHASELRQRGIATSTFGVGADFDERLLRDIATAGGGNFYFVQHAEQIPDLITSELGEALEVVMPGATLTLAVPRGAEAEVLNRFRSRKSSGRKGLVIELDDLVSAQELDVVIRVTFPHGNIDELVKVTATLGEELSEVEFTYAGHPANDEQPRDTHVDRAVARVFSARAHAEATEANRRRDFEEAHRVLSSTARRISEYAGSDAELNEMTSCLMEALSDFDQPMEPMALKQAFFAAESSVRGRSSEGKARRGGS